jgi:hypothetical protein
MRRTMLCYVLRCFNMLMEGDATVLHAVLRAALFHYVDGR